MYQAGTLSGNPLAMAAGLATLELLREPGAYERLELVSAALADGLAAPGRHREPGRRDADRLQSPRPGAVVRRRGRAPTPTATPRFHAHMLERGVYFAPSQFEAAMPSLAHTDEQLEITITAAAEFAG